MISLFLNISQTRERQKRMKKFLFGVELPLFRNRHGNPASLRCPRLELIDCGGIIVLRKGPLSAGPFEK